MEQMQSSTKRVSVDPASVLELAGFVCLVVAAFAVDWRLGLALVGVLLVVAGVAVGRPAPAATVDGES